MSRDSSITYIHMHSSRHADLFEEFCRPPSSFVGGSASTSHPNQANTSTANANPNAAAGDPTHVQLPGHFLPFEEIHLPSHLMPLNPEDEDDVVPDMHAAFGINRALGRGGAPNGASGATGELSGAAMQREPAWVDLGLERLLDGGPVGGVRGTNELNATNAGQAGTVTAARREGRRTGVLLRR